MRTRAPYLLLALLSASIAAPAFALPGEAAAVLRNCGTPAGQEQVTSPVTNRLELNYLYNDLTLHFQPEEGGWSFTTAWHDHFPMTRSELESRLPCFKTAMKQAATTPLPVIDPTIAAQAAVAPVDEATFGIPHLWLIVLLVFTLLLFALVPARPRGALRPGLENLRVRYLRKPSMRNIRPLRKKHLTLTDLS